MGKCIPVLGRVFGFLTPVEEAGRTPGGSILYLCLCKCGNRARVAGPSLLRRDRPTLSCGCMQRAEAAAAKTTHGYSGKGMPEYRAWSHMRQRCTSKKDRAYKNYGGRGINICKRWNSFALFLKDMGLRPTPAHSLDRRNNNRGYSPGNCRWATKAEQLANMRKHVALENYTTAELRRELRRREKSNRKLSRNSGVAA